MGTEQDEQLARDAEAHGLTLAEAIFATRIEMPFDKYAALKQAVNPRSGATSVDAVLAARRRLAEQADVRAQAARELQVEQAKRELRGDAA